MKYLIPILAATALIVGSPLASAQNGNPDLSRGTAPVGMFGHTPVPTPAKEAAAGPKKPLEVSLATSEKGAGAGTSFSKTDPKIFLICKDPSGVQGDKLRAVWTAEETGGTFPKGQKLGEFTQTLPGPGLPSDFFQPAPAGGFPVGKYRVDLYVNSKLAKSVQFTVRK